MWDRVEARLLAAIAAGAEIDIDEEHRSLDDSLEAPLTPSPTDAARDDFRLSMGLA